jgi:hypothetical protein
MSVEPITVDCQITRQKFDFDYDLDNTLEMFMSDLQEQEPPMGFDSTQIRQEDLRFAVFANGNAHIFSANRQATLLSLGVTKNSLVVVTDSLTCIGFPHEPAGLRNKRPSNSLKKR